MTSLPSRVDLAAVVLAALMGEGVAIGAKTLEAMYLGDNEIFRPEERNIIEWGTVEDVKPTNPNVTPIHEIRWWTPYVLSKLLGSPTSIVETIKTDREVQTAIMNVVYRYLGVDEHLNLIRGINSDDIPVAEVQAQPLADRVTELENALAEVKANLRLVER